MYDNTNPLPNYAVDTKSYHGAALPSWVIIIFVLIGLSSLHIFFHFTVHKVFSLHQIMLSSFLVLNLLVNFWEIGLFYTSSIIRKEYLDNRERYTSQPTQAAVDMFNRKVPLKKVFSFKQWTGIWASYCHFDSGYSRRGSFGFNIDIGNGFSTIIPATLFALGMTFEMMPARVLGIIGIAMFWQMFYGTAVYFFQYFNARRHMGHTTKNLLLFVGTSNGMWFVFPIWGLLVSVWLIYMNSYGLFTHPAINSLWTIF